MLPLWLHHRTAIHPAGFLKISGVNLGTRTLKTRCFWPVEHYLLVVPADQGDFVDLPGTDECVWKPFWKKCSVKFAAVFAENPKPNSK